MRSARIHPKHACPARCTRNVWPPATTTSSLNWQRHGYRCAGTGESGPLRDLVKQLEALRANALVPALRSETLPEARPAPEPAAAIDAEYTEVTRAAHPVLKSEPKVLQLRPEQRLPTPEEIQAEREERLAALKAQQAEKRKGRSERVIIGALALIFLLAGLAAAGLSGFANYQAFSSTVADPVQGRIWGWAGVIAAIISFGGFTFVYWHGANGRCRRDSEFKPRGSGVADRRLAPATRRHSAGNTVC
jgi:hypothetical protein